MTLDKLPLGQEAVITAWAARAPCAAACWIWG